MKKEVYFVEMTDTFGGDANYSWVKRLHVRASSVVGAIRKARTHWGCTDRITKAWGDGETRRYNVQGACVCLFVSHLEESSISEGAEIV